ncbi:MAG: RNA-binding transcriptional accessory protein [Saprospiraceae bacterium]|nr:RNA-binding transcriptional accessory protein [Saprospiraceae bacterium]
MQQDDQPNFTQRIATQTGHPHHAVQRVLDLFREGASLPFIARYRKEATGGLDEYALSQIQRAHQQMEALVARRSFILSAIEEAGALTPSLRTQIEQTWDSTTLEDIYLPYKKKRKTRASNAREKGLEPLATIILDHRTRDLRQAIMPFLHADVPDMDAALQGARDILAEWINDDSSNRDHLRQLLWRDGFIQAKKTSKDHPDKEKYRDYFDYHEPVKKIPSHRFLAVRRGEHEGVLRMHIRLHEPAVMTDWLCRRYIKYSGGCADQVRLAIEDSFQRLLMPSLENEWTAELQSRMEDEAIGVFAQNLRQLLLAAPLGQVATIALDPGYRTGCKVACMNAQGDLLEATNIYPLPPQNEKTNAAKTLEHLIRTHQIKAMAIGDGTGGKEAFSWAQSLPFSEQLDIHLVNENGASIYSASDVAREEFPDLDLTFRSAASIGRRLMDPLAELVKIDPKSIGVGQYQHDVHQGKLKQALDETTQFVVNQVGIQINTASEHLLQHVAGLGPVLAKKIIAHRKVIGSFRNRAQIKEVERMGAKTFEQCAGFLRVRNSPHPLDNTGIHPERYGLVEKIARDQGLSLEELLQNPEALKRVPWQHYVRDEVGMPTLLDIHQELMRPGHDPRGRAQSFRFSEEVKDIQDIRIGMVLPGLISNITNFGAFVHLGIKEDGMIHISQMANKFIRHPSEVVKLQQPVQVKVLQVDIPRHRIDLTMKDLS